jgi:hypothetical protein
MTTRPYGRMRPGCARSLHAEKRLRTWSKAIALGLSSFFAAGLSHIANGQTARPTEAEKVMATQLKCDDWRQNPNGTWSSNSAAKIGNLSLANVTIGVHGMDINGADVAVVLNQKCRGTRL